MTLEAGEGSGCGFVSIVGAGPGPADLMTLRALDRLQRAEVVVHDRLITPEVLALVPQAALRVYVGKALGHHSVPQDGIHALLVQHARLGRRVVRLKGGDPYVFGRGDEEVQALQAAAIVFEVFLGVTVASGCSAAAGIPLTHSDLAGSCVFLPGHLADDEATHDWQALARPDPRVLHGRAAPGADCPSVDRLRTGARHPGRHRARRHPGGPDRHRRRTERSGGMRPGYGPQPGLLIIGETVRLSPDFKPSPR